MGIFDVIFSMSGIQSAANVQGSMDELEKYYGRETFFLYSLFAVVPGKKVWPRVIFLTLSISILSWATVTQILNLVIERFTRRVIIDLLPTTVATLGCLLYIPYVVYSSEDQFKALLSIMLEDLKAKRTEGEEAIKQQFFRNTKLLVNAYTLLCICALSFVTVTGYLLPYLLDLVVPLNETHKRQLLIRGEFFFDQEKYYTLIYFVECCCGFVLFTPVIVTENMGIIMGQHVCGMAAVLGHRFENLTYFNDDKLLEKNTFRRLVTYRIYRCIEEQQKIMRFIGLIAVFFDVPLSLALAGTVSSLIVSLVQVTNPELMNSANALFTVCQVFQLYLLSYLGQCSINCTEKLRIAAYSAKWYVFSPSQRMMLQLVIMRASKPCMITARNMYTLSMESFISVMQTITSFYMVLRQTQ